MTYEFTDAELRECLTWERVTCREHRQLDANVVVLCGGGGGGWIDVCCGWCAIDHYGPRDVYAVWDGHGWDRTNPVGAFVDVFLADAAVLHPELTMAYLAPATGADDRGFPMPDEGVTEVRALLYWAGEVLHPDVDAVALRAMFDAVGGPDVSRLFRCVHGAREGIRAALLPTDELAAWAAEVRAAAPEDG